MSSSLFKSVPFSRVPLVRYSVASKRFNKAEVQLLKDFPGIGKRGQVLKVSHSMMRNRLHHNNGACYIVPGQGPRIPVVKIERKVYVPPPPKELQLTTPPKDFKSPASAPPKKKFEINIEGLLLKVPKKQGTTTGKVEATKGYSLFKLSVNLGDLTFPVPEKDDKLITPITKNIVRTQIKRLINIDVPETDMIIKVGKEKIETIEKLGKYKLEVGPENAPASDKVIKNIVVEAAEN